jgi:hypothetical protein
VNTICYFNSLTFGSLATYPHTHTDRQTDTHKDLHAVEEGSPQIIDSGAADNSQQPAASRQQPADSRQQTAVVDSRQQIAATRQQTADNRQQTTDSR